MPFADLLDVGIQLAEARRTAEAHATFASAVAHPAASIDQRATAYYKLGVTLRALSRPHEAVSVLSVARTLMPSDAEVDEELAESYLEVAAQNNGRNISILASSLAAAADLRPSSTPIAKAAAGAMTQEGARLHSLGRLEEAKAAMERAILLSPSTTANAYLNLGILHRQLARTGKYDIDPLAAALEAFAASRSLAPSVGLGYYHAANAMLEYGYAGDAHTAMLEAGVRAAPSHRGLRTNLGFKLLEAEVIGAHAAAEGMRAAAAVGAMLDAAVGVAADVADGEADGVEDSAAERAGQRGERMLHAGLDERLWHTRWQYPAKFTAGLAARRRHARTEYWCILEPLEAASEAMRREALALLDAGGFTRQLEGFAVPPTGWKEADLLSAAAGETACDLAVPTPAGEASDPSLPSPPLPRGLEATCTALRAISHRAGGPLELTGAAFSAIDTGTRLPAHCGPTNERLVLHMGLHVPHPGRAFLRLGTPHAAALGRLSRPRGTARNEEDASGSMARNGLGDEGGDQGGTGSSSDAGSSTSQTDDPAATAEDATEDYEEIFWHEGEAFVWDDSFAHEVLWRDSANEWDGEDPGNRRSSGLNTHGVTATGRSLSDDVADDGLPRIILLLTFRHPGAREHQSGTSEVCPNAPAFVTESGGQ